MKKETYLKIINNTPLDFDFNETLAYLSGVYSIAVEDFDITSDDMLELAIAGDKVKESVLGKEG